MFFTHENGHARKEGEAGNSQEDHVLGQRAALAFCLSSFGLVLPGRSGRFFLNLGRSLRLFCSRAVRGRLRDQAYLCSSSLGAISFSFRRFDGESLESAQRGQLDILGFDEAFEGAFPIGRQEKVRTRVLSLDLARAWSNQELGGFRDVLFIDSRSDICLLYTSPSPRD